MGNVSVYIKKMMSCQLETFHINIKNAVKMFKIGGIVVFVGFSSTVEKWLVFDRNCCYMVEETR